MTIHRTLPGFTGRSSAETRTALVRDSAVGTFVVPGDWVTERRRHELEDITGFFPVEAGNDIDYFHDGRAAFGAMYEEMRDLHEGDFIVILSWFFAYTTEMDVGGPTIEEVLLRAAEAGAHVYLLVWAGSPVAGALAHVVSDYVTHVDVPGSYNNQVHRELLQFLPTNPRAHGRIRVTLDDNDSATGAHHMKVALVKKAGQMVAFYGGMDPHPTRYTGRQGLGWHDLHARVRGPIVRDFYALVTARMNAGGSMEDRAAWASESAGATPAAGTSHARLTRTFVRPSVTSDIDTLLRRAISAARRYIYVADQYLWTELGDNGMGQLIVDQLPHIAHATFLVPNDQLQAGEGESVENRHLSVRAMCERAGELHYKLSFFEHKTRFVHSKLWIIDDEIIVCGSANFSVRSYHTDTEVMVADVDRVSPPTFDLGLTQARRQRMHIWSELLRVPEQRLIDPIASLAYFRRLELGAVAANVRPYLMNGLMWREAMAREAGWRSFSDYIANW